MNVTQAQRASDWWTGSWWLIVVFIGAFVLIAAMAWARAQNKKRSPREEEETEAATRALYQQRSHGQDDPDQR